MNFFSWLYNLYSVQPPLCIDPRFWEWKAPRKKCINIYWLSGILYVILKIVLYFSDFKILKNFNIIASLCLEVTIKLWRFKDHSRGLTSFCTLSTNIWTDDYNLKPSFKIDFLSFSMKKYENQEIWVHQSLWTIHSLYSYQWSYSLLLVMPLLQGQFLKTLLLGGTFKHAPSCKISEVEARTGSIH